MAQCNKQPKNRGNSSRSKNGRKAKELAVDINSEMNKKPEPFSRNACLSPSRSSDNLNRWWDYSPRSFYSRLRQQFPESLENLQNNVETFEEPITESVMSGRPIMSALMNSSNPNFSSEVSDQIEDDVGDQKVLGKSGRRYQSKNIFAERKRRKKLKEKLYALRALVPKITKMDRASILGDAIEFIKELKNQVKELQDELGEEEGNEMNTSKSGINNIQLQLPTNQNTLFKEPKPEKNESFSGSKLGTHQCSSNSKQVPDFVIADDQTQQMEVEVTKIDGNKFFLKVLSKQKRRGFVRLMEAIDSLGLEVTNANITSFKGHVLNVLSIEKRNGETVEADQIRDMLLELIQSPMGGWSKNANNFHYDHHHHHSLDFHA